MGNSHCISSSCATVHYRKYEPPKIRWRYENEPWQEIIGADNYSLEQPKGQCCDLIYRVEVTTYLVRFDRNPSYTPVKFSYIREGTNYASPPIIYGRVLGLEYNNTQKRINGVSRTFFINWMSCSGVQRNSQISSNSDITGWDDSRTSITSITVVGSRLDNCGGCVFKVLKNEQTVYTETRAVCPEVQKIPCQLSTVNKQIEIKKLPFLEKVEVVPYQYSAYKLPGIGAPINQADPIPSQCLNVYNNAIYVIPPDPDAVKYPNAEPFNSFIAQICSASGCPPPEYEVICDCITCESCPNGTCPVECDGQICCYDTATGKAVQTIALANYCGGQS